MRPLLLLLVAGASAGPLHHPVEGGHVDWSRGVLVASASSSGGAGPLTSRRTLEQEAWLRLEALLAERAAEIQVTADVVAGDLMVGQDPLALRLQEGLRTWRITRTRYHRSGQVDLQAELVLRDWLRPALLGWASTDRPERTLGGPTGLVVDARGLGAHPAVVPRLIGPDQAVLFGPEHVVAGRLAEHPPVVWVTDPADPAAVAQAGGAPIVVGATAVRQGSDLVLDPRDGESLQALTTPRLRHGIVVVVDP